MTTKCKLIGNGLVGFIVAIDPILNTNPQTHFSNLFWKVTLKFQICMYHSTLSHGKKVVTKVESIVKAIVRYLDAYVRS
jgi:hypothetical protein